MKKFLLYLSTLMLVLGLAACGSENEPNTEPEIKVETTAPTPASNETEEKEEETVEEVGIDTSVFEYAVNVEVTDARELNSHLTLRIQVSNDANPGMTTLDVLKQTFDFLYQDDIKGADTITIYIVNDSRKFFQFTVNTTKFEPNEIDPMANLVLNASEIEVLPQDVEEFGKTFELW